MNSIVTMQLRSLRISCVRALFYIFLYYLFYYMYLLLFIQVTYIDKHVYVLRKANIYK